MTILCSELAETLMGKVRRTCGSKVAATVLVNAREIGDQRDSVSNLVMSRDVQAALRQMKLEQKVSQGIAYVDPERVDDAPTGKGKTATAAATRLNGKSVTTPARKVKRGKTT